MLSLRAYFFFFVVLAIHLGDLAWCQQLADPAREYKEGVLGGRKIFWCPSGYGYLAYCPQPSDFDDYSWCCVWPYRTTWKPSCCQFAIPTGAIVGVTISAILLSAFLVALSCWCCYFCPLHRKLYFEN